MGLVAKTKKEKWDIMGIDKFIKSKNYKKW